MCVSLSSSGEDVHAVIMTCALPPELGARGEELSMWYLY